MIDEDKVIEQTKQWIRTVVIDCNFCPFAAKPFAGKKIRYKVLADSSENILLETLIEEWQLLDEDAAIETSFLIFKDGFNDFDSYLEMIHTAEELLADEAYEGVYQLASFHPLYCFEGATESDASNYTNRSPYAMIHILRESSLSDAIASFKNVDLIPERNIQFANAKGLKYMQALRGASLL
jgi:hypothetical protein